MDIAEEFQSRRAQTWRRARFSLAIVLFGLLYLVFGCGAGWPSTLCVVVFLAVSAAIVHATFVCRRLYRCPGCEECVTDIEGGIPLDPHTCRKCGATLRQAPKGRLGR